MFIPVWIFISLVVFCAFLILYAGSQKLGHEKEIDLLVENYRKREMYAREDAIAKSRAVNKGQVFEQLVPIFPDFPYNPAECKFMGKPIDFIVFKGMEEALINAGKEVEVIFVDVKTGKAQLTKGQSLIKKAVKEGRIKFEVWRIDENNKIIIS